MDPRAQERHDPRECLWRLVCLPQSPFSQPQPASASLRYETLHSALAIWNADSDPQSPCLQADGTLVVTGGELRISDEHDDFAWVAADQLADWEVVEPMKPVMRKMQALL